MNASAWKWLPIALALLLLSAALTFFVYRSIRPEPEPAPAPQTYSGPVTPVVSEPSPPPTVGEVEEEIIALLPESPPGEDALLLPETEAPLAESEEDLDALFIDEANASEALIALVAGGRDLLVEQNFVRRIVVTVDNLPKRKLAMAYLPVKRPEGMFMTDSGRGLRIGAENYTRYRPFVLLLEALDDNLVADAYARNYAVFQAAYDELGYGAQFHTRLLRVIDHMLGAPEIEGPVALAQPKVLYIFDDPALETMSAGHKIMVRIGLGNAARVKAKLRSLRTQLAAKSPV